MPRAKNDRGAHRRRREQDDVASFIPKAAIGHHIHTHEIHGFEQVRRLRRRYRVALGYPAREP